jgi:predicted Zn-dependent peptidase
MEAVGRNMLLRDIMLESAEVVDKINSVSVKSMYELAEKMFRDDKLSISVVGK